MASMTDQQRITDLERQLAEKRDYIKLMDAVIDDEHIARSCINPLEDLKHAIAGLKAECERLREGVEYWMHDGHLQTWKDRERFREAMRELLKEGE